MSNRCVTSLLALAAALPITAIGTTTLQQSVPLEVAQSSEPAGRPGDLDPTFGANGSVLSPVPSPITTPALALQQDQKLVALTWDKGGVIHLIRYHADGSLDRTFGTAGLAMVPRVADFPSMGLSALVIQPDGMLVVAGGVINSLDSRIFLARFTATGAVDTSFGSEGFGELGVIGCVPP